MKPRLDVAKIITDYAKQNIFIDIISDGYKSNMKCWRGCVNS